MNTKAFNRFDRVVGGELPISAAESSLWLTHGKPKAVEELSASLNLLANQSLWLRFGRSAIGVALGSIGMVAGNRGSVPEYMCPVVINKLLSYGAHLEAYPLTHSLSPVPEDFLKRASVADFVLTCSFFGTQENDTALGDLAVQLSALPNAPWVIEDRVMAAPYSLSAAVSAGRCDFLVTSFRKGYSVPDGALLVAVSERASAALDITRNRIKSQVETQMPAAILEKVAAKRKRHNWLNSTLILDDPAVNAVVESMDSERAVDALADDNVRDGESGSTASAAWLCSKNLNADHDTLRKRFQVVAGALLPYGNDAIPLREGVGIGVPMLVRQRDLFRAEAAAHGIFLPIHWLPQSSLGRMLRNASATARLWHAEEVTLPIHLEQTDEDLEHAIETIAPLLCAYA